MHTLNVALTGATGYIASHIAVALAEHGHWVVGVDNFANSSAKVLDRVATIADTKMPFAEIDLSQTNELAAFFTTNKVDAVIHLAGLKSVGESVAEPLHYYQNNVAGSISLLQAMETADVHGMVFSSSATVYDPNQPSPLQEDAALGPINPYGRTKLMVEQIINDVAAQSAHTPDGTGVRDYIHVCDLADGHVAAVNALATIDSADTINLGTGVGSSVRDVLAAAEGAADKPIPHRVVGRRPGDADISFADPARARERLRWQAKRTLADACQDHWRWQHQNPEGYSS